MNLLQETKKNCQLYDIRPVKGKGQNFLVEEKILDQILQAADITNQDNVLEVGPGFGILTAELLKKSKHVLAIELDVKLFNFLQANLKKSNKLEIVNQDILDFNPQTHGLGKYKIVANLPYAITSPFLQKFLTAEKKPEKMVLLVQKEVAQRICARPGSMSLLSIAVQLYSKPSIFLPVSKNNFYPQPDVESAIIKLDNIINNHQVEALLKPVSEKEFWRLAKIGFSARRKQLHNNLTNGYHISSAEAKSWLIKANIDPTIRAQSLKISDWILLAKIVNNYSK